MNNIKGLGERKREEVAGMVSLNEVAGLVQQIESHMDDSDCEILGILMDSRGSSVNLWHDTFLSEFLEFDIRVKDEPEFPYRLSASILGVEFSTLLNAADILELKDTMPDQWEYIQNKLQVEVA